MWCLFALVSLQFSVAACYVSAERLKACGAERRHRSARYQAPVFDKGAQRLGNGLKARGAKGIGRQLHIRQKGSLTLFVQVSGISLRFSEYSWQSSVPVSAISLAVRVKRWFHQKFIQYAPVPVTGKCMSMCMCIGKCKGKCMDYEFRVLTPNMVNAYKFHIVFAGVFASFGVGNFASDRGKGQCRQ